MKNKQPPPESGNDLPLFTLFFPILHHQIQVQEIRLSSEE